MEVKEAINTRRSTRKFKSYTVQDDDLWELLEAAIKAPSAGNVQPWKFTIIKEEQLKWRLTEAAFFQHWVYEAPVVIVVMADLQRAEYTYGRRGVELYCIQDTAAAVQNLLLAGVEKGIYGCWIGAFDEKQVSRILNLPAEWRPMALLPLGYPETVPPPTSRRRLKEVVW